MIKYLLSAFLIVFTTFNLHAQKQIVHYNIIFAPDLSNRLNKKLYPKPVSDTAIISGFLKKVWPDILKYKRDDNQLDHYGVDFINKGLIGIYQINTEALALNFQRFNKQVDRINYIMSRSGVSQTLSKDIKNFLAEYNKFNNRASTASNGADVWTYFQSGIDGRIMLSNISNGKVINAFRNIMVLMTDGYIEAGIFGKGYDLSASKVAAFRNEFLKSTENDIANFLMRNPKFRINPVKNPFLNNLEVIVLEMYDRSLSVTGTATKHPTDMEIMKVIWADWFKNSHVKRFELKAIANNKQEAVKYIIDFIKS